MSYRLGGGGAGQSERETTNVSKMRVNNRSKL